MPSVRRTGQKLIAVYLFDETEILTYKQMVNDQKMVAGLIYLDNRRGAGERGGGTPFSFDRIDRPEDHQKYITAMNGIVKKLERISILLRLSSVIFRS